ncbi:DNA repair protein RadC [Candidatus Woesebacteria bacterium]|nr:DNA repair protein RadC [Candidatus Woesebacteria bacterium]
MAASLTRPVKRIKDLPPTARPREKLLLRGKANLQSNELLAILLGTGTKKANALVLADKLLSKYALGELVNLTVYQLAAISGIGKTKAARILAAVELGERLFAPKSLTTVILNSAANVLPQLNDIIEKNQEYLVALYVDARNQLLHRELVALGSLNATRIEPKEIFSAAISLPCAGIYLAHNHPSGDPTPSEDDVRFTARIQSAAAILGFKLLDHIIVSRQRHFSFQEYGLMPKR